MKVCFSLELGFLPTCVCVCVRYGSVRLIMPTGMPNGTYRTYIVIF